MLGDLVALLVGYLFGSIPFGLLLTRAAGLGDIRAIGSGNIGATNVLRTGRKSLAAATILLDTAKGAVPVLIATAAAGDHAPFWAAAGAVLGHLFPVWLKFRGGKGVATGIGAMLALDWRMGLTICAFWLIMVLLFRRSSLAGLTGFAAAPLAAWGLGNPALAKFSVIIGALIYAKHHANIQRLLAGTEPKIGQKSRADQT
jgi:acyl phosphate:glycerol-3-phosphate acyltransferase